jgi:hypothetical protein
MIKLFCRILVIVSLCDRIRVRCFSMKKYSGLELAGHAAAGESISEGTFGAGSAEQRASNAGRSIRLAENQ